MTYYGSALSPNLTETKEGYLIAMNVPIARTGTQKYLPGEIELSDEGADIEDFIGSDGMVTVIREEDEVFSPATIASFEGKPATEGHPHTGSETGMIDASNEGLYRKGHMQNVRRGTGENADNLVADLFITDPMIVQAVKSRARREVSCGYMSEFVPENGKVYQRVIRGNHIAIVPHGRAGRDVAIHDSMPPQAGRRTEHMSKENIIKKVFGLGLKEYVKDAEPEELTDLMGNEHTAAAAPAVPAVDTPAPPVGGDIDSKIDKLIGIVEQLVASDKKVHAELPTGDAMAALDEGIAAEAKREGEPEEEEKEEKSESIEDEKPGCGSAPAGDSAVDFVKRMKVIVAKMPAGATRDEAANELLAILKGGKSKPATSIYGDIATATRGAHVADAKPAQAQTIAEKSQTFADNCKKARDEGGK